MLEMNKKKKKEVGWKSKCVQKKNQKEGRRKKAGSVIYPPPCYLYILMSGVDNFVKHFDFKQYMINSEKKSLVLLLDNSG